MTWLMIDGMLPTLRARVPRSLLLVLRRSKSRGGNSFPLDLENHWVTAAADLTTETFAFVVVVLLLVFENSKKFRRKKISSTAKFFSFFRDEAFRLHQFWRFSDWKSFRAAEICCRLCLNSREVMIVSCLPPFRERRYARLIECIHDSERSRGCQISIKSLKPRPRSEIRRNQVSNWQTEEVESEMDLSKEAHYFIVFRTKDVSLQKTNFGTLMGRSFHYKLILKEYGGVS